MLFEEALLEFHSTFVRTAGRAIVTRLNMVLQSRENKPRVATRGCFLTRNILLDQHSSFFCMGHHELRTRTCLLHIVLCGQNIPIMIITSPPKSKFVADNGTMGMVPLKCFVRKIRKFKDQIKWKSLNLACFIKFRFRKSSVKKLTLRLRNVPSHLQPLAKNEHFTYSWSMSF